MISTWAPRGLLIEQVPQNAILHLETYSSLVCLGQGARARVPNSKQKSAMANLDFQRNSTRDHARDYPLPGASECAGRGLAFEPPVPAPALSQEEAARAVAA